MNPKLIYYRRKQVIVLHTLRWIWDNLKGHHGKMIVGMILQALVAGMVIINPSITGQIVDQVVIGVKNSSGEYVRNPAMLIPLLIAMVAIQFMRMGGYYLLIILFEKASQGMIVTMRTKLYDNLELLDLSYYSKNRQGDIMTRLTGDLDMMRYGVAYIFRQLANSVILYVAALVYLFTINWAFTLCLIALTPIIVVVRNKFSKRARPIYQNNRERLTLLNGYAQENIENNRIVKAFAREEYEIDRFEVHNKAYQKANIDSAMVWLRVHPLIAGLSESLNIIIILVGGVFIMNGWLTFGELSVYLSLAWVISGPMSTLGALLSDIERFMTSAEKVMSLYYAKSSIVSPAKAYSSDEKLKGDIVFDHVDFSFESREILSDIDFHVKPGETLAIMGNTGSGKTTIINLLARFFDVKSGAVKIDGRDVRDYDLQYLRKNIGMAPQEVFLFSETVDSNIAYGVPDLPEEDVYKFARVADADSFIRKMPESYNTIVGERGVGLSGGQRQRIALARALAVDPAILVLDDTTSAVDVETEQYIWKELDKLNLSCTRIVIANRVSSVRYADHILILENGHIAEYGNHDELMKLNGIYHETFVLQNEGIMSGMISEGGEA